jgi:hypothetical protein
MVRPKKTQSIIHQENSFKMRETAKIKIRNSNENKKSAFQLIVRNIKISIVSSKKNS